MGSIRSRVTYANVATTLALFLALGGSAWAAGSSLIGSGGRLHGCVPKHGGPLSLVAAGKRCTRGQQAITFDRTGPTGPRGLDGTTGAMGATGATGPQAIQGIAGPGAVRFSIRGTTDIAKTQLLSIDGLTLYAICKSSSPQVILIGTSRPRSTSAGLTPARAALSPTTGSRRPAPSRRPTSPSSTSPTPTAPSRTGSSSTTTARRSSPSTSPTTPSRAQTAGFTVRSCPRADAGGRGREDRMGWPGVFGASLARIDLKGSAWIGLPVSWR